jgi:hypothetical protein
MIQRPWHGSARSSVGLTRLIPSRADRLGMLRIPVLDAWPRSKKERQTTSLLTTNVPYKEPAERLGAAHAALIYEDLATSDRVQDPRRCTQASALAASMGRSGASSPWPSWRDGAHRCSIGGLYASFGRGPGWLAQDQQRRRTAGWQRRGANGFMRCRSGSQQAGTRAGVLAKTRAQTAR